MLIATIGSFSNTLLIILMIIIIGILVAFLRRPIPPPTVPEDLKVQDWQVVLLKALGRGVQIYTCKAKSDDPSKLEWTFKAPEADLFNHKGEKIGKHYAGHTWEANDGSKVVGEVKARADEPDASAIPWLLVPSHRNKNH
jgi:phosphoglycerol transferase MdoB-like AlkP superfamily enzyme